MTGKAAPIDSSSRTLFVFFFSINGVPYRALTSPELKQTCRRCRERRRSWGQACAELAFSTTASRNKVLITLKCDEYECIVTVFKMPCSRRDAGKKGMAAKPAGQRERHGSPAILPSVVFFCYFTFFDACPIIMSLPFMIGSFTANNKVVYRYDERSRRSQLHTRINAEEFVPRSVSLSSSSCSCN